MDRRLQSLPLANVTSSHQNQRTRSIRCSRWEARGITKKNTAMSGNTLFVENTYPNRTAKLKSKNLSYLSLNRITGIRKIVRDSVIVKPKVERLQLSHGVKPEDIKDFVGPREFLTKFNGVKQKMHEASLAAKRLEEREKRTFSKLSK